jgi:hypothetical protein
MGWRILVFHPEPEANKRAIYRLGIISLAHAPVHVTDFPVVNVYVDELSSAGIWQHKLCATLSANVNIKQLTAALIEPSLRKARKQQYIPHFHFHEVNNSFPFAAFVTLSLNRHYFLKNSKLSLLRKKI